MTGKLVPEIAVTCGVTDHSYHWYLSFRPVNFTRSQSLAGGKKPPESVGRSPRMNFLGESCEYTGLHGHYPGWITHTFSCSGSALPGHVEWCPVCRSCNSDCVTKRMGWGCGSWTETSFFPTSPAWLVYIVKPHFFFYNDKLLGVNSRSCSKGIPKSSKGKFGETYCSWIYLIYKNLRILICQKAKTYSFPLMDPKKR